MKWALADSNWRLIGDTDTYAALSDSQTEDAPALAAREAK